MSENCEFCGEPLYDGVCQNTDCPQEFDLPAMSDSAEQYPEFPSVADDEMAPALSTDDDFSPHEPAREVEGEPAMSIEGTGDGAPAISESRPMSGPFLTLEQAAMPIDHTGTIIFDADLHAGAAMGAMTRLTDDQDYRNIRTILKESISSDFDKDAEPSDSRLSRTTDLSQVHSSATDRPELSQTIRLKNPFESERTAHRLPSRDLSVPSNSASLEKRKQGADEDYSFDNKDYKIISKVGEGGSGVIYEAQQIALRRRVAVKVLKQRKSKQGSRSRTATKELEKRKARFLHEVNITAKLQHPNIIPLYDLGVNSQGEVFYAMKLIGETEEEAVQQSWATLVRTTLSDQSHASIERNVQIFEKVCDAVRYAHSEKIVHRDLKPDNVMVGKFGEVLVIDWGMALDLSNGKEPFTAGGTTSYMPPEMGLHYLKQSEMHVLSQSLMMKLEGSRRESFVEAVLDHGNHFAAADLLQDDTLSDEVHSMCRELLRLDAQEKELAGRINFSSDIYLLGAILYEIAVGHPPHYVPLKSCKNIEEKHHREFWLASNQHIQRLNQVTDPLRLSLCNIALRALQADQRDRYKTVDELQQALTGFKNQVQSLQLVEKGRTELEKAQGGDGYMHLLPALESFRGAETLFPLGDEAQRLQIDTACEYARRADRRKDFDAGLSILDEYVLSANRRNPEVMKLTETLIRGKKIAARNRRLAAVGWLAAVILPIGVWGASWLQTAQLRSDNAALAQKNDDADKNLQLKQTELTTKEATLQLANQQLQTKEQELAKVVEEVQRQQQELATKQTELNEKTSQLTMKTGELVEKTTELTNKEQQLNEKNEALAGAQTKISQAENRAEQLRFESAEGLFNSLILPIPLDLRKGNLESAISRLETLRNSDLSPQFKNDWVARHFEKTLNASGIATNLGADAAVIRVLHRPAGDPLVVGTQRGALHIWRVDSRNGQPSVVPAELPQSGRVVEACSSVDGKWLALALDDVLDQDQRGEPIWLINLITGKRVAVPIDGQTNTSVLGCRAIGLLSDQKNSNRLYLVTVEELTAYRGLKERLQIVARTLNVDGEGLSLASIKRNPIPATTRDDRRVNYATTMDLNQTKPAVAIVYGSLSPRGEEISRLQTFIAEGGVPEFESPGESLKLSEQSTAVAQYPTAMHLSRQGRLYCGYADGRIDTYQTDRLTDKPQRSTIEHESSVTVLDSSSDGTLVSGAANGVLLVMNDELKIIKRLVGHSDGLSSVSFQDVPGRNSAEPSAEDPGVLLFTGGTKGQIRFWLPEGTTHDASIRKQESLAGNPAELRLGGNRTVTCGAVDRSWKDSEAPAAAYGTSDGQVFYFNSLAMRSRATVQEIPTDGKDQSASVSIPAPPGSFDTSFGNFESFGLVGNQFVLLQSDGKLFSTAINPKSREPGAQTSLSDLALTRILPNRLESAFVPLMATVKDQPVFFTNNPANGREILVWKRPAGADHFVPAKTRSNSETAGRVKRLRLSPDGKWLAVIREVEETSATGEYVTEILAVDSQADAESVLSKINATGQYRVGDPAFVGFSADSQKLIFHFHKLGIDRETWIETWNLTAGRWDSINQKRRIDNRRVDLVGWDGENKLITKINRQFYVSQADQAERSLPREYQPEVSNRLRSLRSVLPAQHADGQYVLFDQSLSVYDDRGIEVPTARPVDLSNARDIKVFGDQAVVLDDQGFHLINENLEYVGLIARRKISTTALSLANDRLAITYNVGGLCRIMDVSTKPATEIGRFGDAKRVQLSSDGKWAMCQRDRELQIFAIDSSFEKPSFVQPIDATNWSAEWIGTVQPNLLVAIQADNGTNLSWREIDPRNNQVKQSEIRLPGSLESGQLVEFQLATHTKKYVSLIKQNGGRRELELWAISPVADPVSMTSMAGLKATELNAVSVAFSEVDRQNKSEIGTRLMVLDRDEQAADDSKPATSRIFLLADEQIADSSAMPPKAGEPIPTKTIYRVFEIAGVIDVTDGRQLVHSQFSGDGRSLLEVDSRGLKLLLTKDW